MDRTVDPGLKEWGRGGSRGGRRGLVQNSRSRGRRGRGSRKGNGCSLSKAPVSEVGERRIKGCRLAKAPISKVGERGKKGLPPVQSGSFKGKEGREQGGNGCRLPDAISIKEGGRRRERQSCHPPTSSVALRVPSCSAGSGASKSHLKRTSLTRDSAASSRRCTQSAAASSARSARSQKLGSDSDGGGPGSSSAAARASAIACACKKQRR
eukprot:359668-Chlamydomonas_euryale.AAC.2